MSELARYILFMILGGIMTSTYLFTVGGAHTSSTVSKIRKEHTELVRTTTLATTCYDNARLATSADKEAFLLATQMSDKLLFAIKNNWVVFEESLKHEQRERVIELCYRNLNNLLEAQSK